MLTGSLIGGLGGPVVVGAAQAVAPHLDIDAVATAWLLAAILLLPTMLLVLGVRPDPLDIARALARYFPEATGIPTRRTTADAPAGVRAWCADPRLRMAFVASAAAYGCMAMLMALTPVALAHHGHGLSQISLAVGLHVVAMYGLSVPLGRLSDTLGRGAVLVGGLLLLGVGCLLVPASGGEYVLASAGLGVVGLGWSAVTVSAAAVIADAVDPRERGRAIGASDALSGLAWVVFPLMAGALLEVGGLPSIGGLGLVVTLAAAGLALPGVAPCARRNTVVES